jgi:hypothetical protein
LAQYGQVQNILAAQSQRQAAGTQNELAQLQVGQARMTMQQVQEAHDFVNKTMNAAAENGAPTKDPMDIAMQMSAHPTNATVQAMGEHLRKNLEILRAYQQDKAFAARGQQQPPQPLTATQLPPAGGATPVLGSDPESFKAWVADKTTNLEYKDWLAQQNAAQTPNQMLPAAAAVAPAESVNKLATPISKVDQIDAEIADLQSPQYMYSPQAKARIEFLNKRRDQLTKAHVVGSNLVTEEGKAIYTGKEKDSEFEQLLNKSNLSEDEKTTLRVARARKEASHAPAISITNKQEGAFEGGLGKGQADRIFASQVAAEDAAAIIDTVKTGRDIMKSGMITGAGADFLVNLNQGLKTAGIDAGYADASANSQAFAANMAGNVGKLIKQFGAGTGLSDDDREFAKDMAGGRISLDAKAINRILDINEKAARNTITRHNKNVKGIKTNIPLEVEMPPAAPSAPVVTAPASAVDYLRANPTMKGAFDAKYGAGAADRALKGQ